LQHLGEYLCSASHFTPVTRLLKFSKLMLYMWLADCQLSVVGPRPSLDVASRIWNKSA